MIESRELGQIEHALNRIAEGAYGRCECCGDKISAVRLDALPYATSCIGCQRETERQGRSTTPARVSNPWAKVIDATNEKAQNDEIGYIRLNRTEIDNGSPVITAV